MLTKVKAILAFFIGIFGAMAILGVFFKIMKWSNYELFMVVGFIGEAAAFVTMGLLELTNLSSKNAKASGAAGAADGPIPSGFAKAVEAKLDAQLDAVLGHFAGEVAQFSTEMRALGAELELSRLSVQQMRSQLDAVATGDLAGDAQQLGNGMASLGAEMVNAGRTVETMRHDLELMASRFHQFNAPSIHGSGQDRGPVAHQRLGVAS